MKAFRVRLLANGWATPFWCADGGGEWAFRQHTGEQIQQAAADGKAHVVACQTTLEELSALVVAANTAEHVALVIWPEA